MLLSRLVGAAFNSAQPSSSLLYRREKSFMILPLLPSSLFPTMIPFGSNPGSASFTSGGRPIDRLAFHKLHDNKGARKKKFKIGRGLGSGIGKTSGRGMNGQNSRPGLSKPRPGFEGGQNPLYKKVRKKRGFPNKNFQLYFEPLGLDRLQYFIDTGRLPLKNPITIRDLKDCGVMPKLKQNVKIVSSGKEWFSVPLNIEVGAVSEKAKEAIEKAGGKVTTVYFSEFCLGEFLRTPLNKIATNFSRAPSSIAHRFDVTKYQLPEEIRYKPVTLEGPINIYENEQACAKRVRFLTREINKTRQRELTRLFLESQKARQTE